MPFLENLVEGFAGAAGDQNTVGRIENQKFDRKATEHEELQAKTQSILDDVHQLQQRRVGLDPKSPTYQKDVGAIDQALHDARQTFTDLYHPEKNPGALAKLGGFLQAHIGRQKAQVPTTPAQAKQSFQQRQEGIESVAYAPGAEAAGQLKPLTGTKPYKGADGRYYQSMLAPDGTIKAQPLPEGYEPPAAKAGSKKIREALEPDKDSPTGWSKVAYDLETGEEVSRQKNVAPQRGLIESETKTTDPFGVTSTSIRRPILGGAGTQAQPSAKPAAVPKTPGEAKQRAATVAPAYQLDAQGHIPATAKVNPYLREAANQIIDGMDISKSPLPARDRQAAAELARQYGWKGQGMFGPKDMLMLRESTGILKQLKDAPSLSVFDDFASRQKIAQVIQNPDKRGMIGQFAQSLTAANLSEQEQQFVTLYNQAVGRISGLSQLVRSGRATEATIERLKQELPNPFNTQSSAHARQKLDQIQNEIDIAMQKGQFVDTEGGSTQDIGDTVYARDPQGKLHKGKKGTPLPQGWKAENAPATQ